MKSKLLWLVPALLLAALLAADGRASDCRVYTPTYAPAYAPVVPRRKVVEEVVVHDTIAAFPVVAQLVTVPLYSTVFAPPAVTYAAPAPQGPAYGTPAYGGPAYGTPPPASQDAVLLALGRLEARLGQLEQRVAVPVPGVTPAPPVPAAGPPVPGTTPAPPSPLPAAEPQARAGAGVPRVFTARCARCHDAARSATAGGGFTLLSGGRVAALGPQQKLNVWSQALSGRMPKGGPKLTDEELSETAGWLATP